MYESCLLFLSIFKVTPEQLDPYTLYVGNLPTKLNVTIFKEKFPTAKRIDIGYAQRTKFTRYAFLHYDNVEESMEAFKSTYNLTIDARSLVVRFRRNKGSVGLSEKGKKTRKDEGVEGDLSGKIEMSRAPSTSKLFDDEIDTKADVLKKAEELRKAGCKTRLFSLFNFSLFRNKKKLFENVFLFQLAYQVQKIISLDQKLKKNLLNMMKKMKLIQMNMDMEMDLVIHMKKMIHLCKVIVYHTMTHFNKQYLKNIFNFR